MRNKRDKRRGNVNGRREHVCHRREQTSRDGICEIVDRVCINKRNGNASYLAHFLRVSDREVSHEVGATAFRVGANDTLVITVDGNFRIVNTHDAQSKDGQLDSNPF
jgi:hypothetical protein